MGREVCDRPRRISSRERLGHIFWTKYLENESTNGANSNQTTHRTVQEQEAPHENSRPNSHPIPCEGHSQDLCASPNIDHIQRHQILKDLCESSSSSSHTKPDTGSSIRASSNTSSTGLQGSGSGGSGAPPRIAEDDYALPAKTVLWRETKFYHLTIRQGPKCKYKIDDLVCFWANYIPEDGGPPAGYFTEIVERQQSLLENYIPKSTSVDKVTGKVHRFINKANHGDPVLQCGIYLCGKNEQKLSPMLVVSYNGTVSFNKLKDMFDGECVGSMSGGSENWLPYKVSPCYPETEKSPVSNANDMVIPREYGLTLESEESSQPNSDDSMSDPASEHVASDPHATRNVYISGDMTENSEIRLPKKVYIGSSPQHCKVATLGGLTRIKDSEVFGLTVGHTAYYSGEDIAQAMQTPQSEGPNLEEINQMSEEVNEGAFTLIGRVIRYGDPSSLYSDWASVEFGPGFDILNSVTPSGISGPDFSFSKNVDHYHKRVIIHFTRYNVPGYLGPYPCLMHTLDQPFWIITYPIRLPDGYCTAPGDSGSWVMDLENRFCGHICYGSADSPFAWMLPGKEMTGEIYHSSTSTSARHSNSHHRHIPEIKEMPELLNWTRSEI